MKRNLNKLHTKRTFFLCWLWMFCFITHSAWVEQISEYLRTRCSFSARLAEFNWERCRRLTATVKVIRPPCAVYCGCSERTGLSTLIMYCVLIVCLWDNGAAEKRISSCSDFHQSSCQTFSLFTLHLPTRPFSPKRCWGDGRPPFILFRPSDGRKTPQ